eukprot:6210954-Pleurochrysis_carterae.AAC.2
MSYLYWFLTAVAPGGSAAPRLSRVQGPKEARTEAVLSRRARGPARRYRWRPEGLDQHLAQIRKIIETCGHSKGGPNERC